MAQNNIFAAQYTIWSYKYIHEMKAQSTKDSQPILLKNAIKTVYGIGYLVGLKKHTISYLVNFALKSCADYERN